MLHHVRPILAVCLLLLAALSLVAADGPSSKPREDASIEQLVADLGSAEFSTRQQATRKLVDAGKQAVGPLSEAARGESLEAAVRAVTILEKIYLSQTEADVDAAEEALERLVASPLRSVSGRADWVLESHYDLRQQRAVAKIEAHGGKITYNENPAIDPNAANSDVRPISFVLLGTEWKGDDGLKYVKRLTRLQMVYLVEGSKVSEEGLKDLTRAMPQLIIQHRGKAYLGVSAFPHPQGVQVAIVKEGTAAHKAGINQGDVIVKFDGKAVPDFDTLIDLIATKKPGDKVELDLQRFGEKKTLTVELGGWQ